MKIGILGAMDIEIEYLKEKIDITLTKNICNIDFYVGKIGNNQVTLAKCGIGKVNAAIATQLMINYFDVDGIINIGVAGSLSNNLNISDIVISKDLVQHDFDTTGVGDKLGYISGTGKIFFEADETLINKTFEIAKDILSSNVVIGRIASGDQFVYKEEQKKAIVKNFDPLCVEMEGCAIAQACHINNMPFLVIRAISDKADGSSTVDFNEFKKIAANNAATLLEKLIISL